MTLSVPAAPRYPAYRSSGIEWLGEIPEHWEVKRLKFSAPEAHEKYDRKPDDKVYIGLENIESQTGRLLLDAPAENVESSVVGFQKGDVLFGKLRPYLAKVAEAEFSGVCTSEALVYRPEPGVYSRYLFYALLSPRFIDWVNSLTYGARMPRANSSQIGNSAFAIPPLSEQRAIAAYLDRETGQLDALTAKKQRLITLLEEKRAALISHAVTRGLHPDAPTRPSGIEWLGEIPEHWEIKKIAHMTTVGNGSTPDRDNPDYWQDGWFPWLNSSLVNQDEINEAQQFVTDIALKECHLPIVPPGSVLVGITGQGKTRGMSAILTFEATINQHLAYIVPAPHHFSAHYLQKLFVALYSHLRHISDGAGSTKGALTCEQLKQLKICVPPVSEQAEIAEYLDRQTGKIDALIAKVRTHILLLKERRAALIAAVVTGKRDVRGRVTDADCHTGAAADEEKI